ncbi:MAG: class I SAM-dependent methyltransferase [bacterium]
MLNDKIGFFKYLLWRNDKIWPKLSQKEQERVLQANKSYNNIRDDYKNPEFYGDGRVVGGENWDASDNRLSFFRGAIINEVLEGQKPKSILEIGPGPGFYTRLICEKKYVQEYIGIDIVQPFLDYLKPRLENLKTQKSDFVFQLACDDFMNLNYASRFDLIVLLSTVHHIPNRQDLFFKLSEFLKKDGLILCIDPSHYWRRKLHLLKSMCFYLKKSYYSKLENLGTHHMCSSEEYEKLASKNGMVIEKEWFILPKKFMKNRVLSHHSWWRRASSEIAILLKKL